MKALNLIRAVTAVAAFAALVPVASAQSVNGAVDLSVTLTSRCRLQTTTAPVLNFGTYTAFQTGAATAPNVSLVFECTRGYGTTSTATWDTTGGSAAGMGALAGLQYALTSSSAVTAAGSPATAAALGTPATITYTVGGSIAGGQAGTDTTGAATATRTLTVTF